MVVDSTSRSAPRGTAITRFRRNRRQLLHRPTQILAIEAKPIGGIHIAYIGRSIIRLASGNFSGALDDVREALALAPQYAEAYICQGDVFLAMDQLEDAEESYAMALRSNPSLRRSKAFKARVELLHEKRTGDAVC